MSARIVDVPTAWAGRLSDLQHDAWWYAWRLSWRIDLGRETDNALSALASMGSAPEARKLAEAELARRESLS